MEASTKGSCTVTSWSTTTGLKDPSKMTRRPSWSSSASRCYRSSTWWVWAWSRLEHGSEDLFWKSSVKVKLSASVFRDFVWYTFKASHLIYPQSIWRMLMHTPCACFTSFSSEPKTVIPPVAATSQVRIFVFERASAFHATALQALGLFFHSTGNFTLCWDVPSHSLLFFPFLFSFSSFSSLHSMLLNQFLLILWVSVKGTGPHFALLKTKLSITVTQIMNMFSTVRLNNAKYWDTN